MKRTLILSIIMGLFICSPIDVSAKDFLKGVTKLTGKVKKGAETFSDAVNNISSAVGTTTEAVQSTQSSTSASVSGTSSSSATRDTSLRTQSNIEGLKIKVKSCNVDDENNAIIVFTIENYTDSNVTCSMRNGDSEVYDDEGNCYQGEKKITYAPGNETVFPNYCDAKLPSGIPTKWKMRVRNIDPAATMLTQVKIYLYELPIGNMTGSLYIYNLPITREGDEE